MRLTQAAAIAKYGEIVEGKWATEGKFCRLYPVPIPIAKQLINSLTGEPTWHIYVNTDITNQLEKAFTLVCNRGLVSELKTFDGCYMIRDVRGIPGQLSCHAYACALDFNASTNKLGTLGDISQALADCFIESGFSWGKYFKRTDPMHFSCAWE